MIVVSWIAAFVCCIGYGVGSVLQSAGARRAATAGGRRGVLLIIVQLPYLLGLLADGIAFVANVVAARQLPLFLVQAIMAASIGVTAIIVAARGTRLGARDWTGLGALSVGLVLLVISAEVSVADRVSTSVGWIILLSCLAPAIVGLVGYRLHGRTSWGVLALASGLGFGLVAVASRGLGSDQVDLTLLANPLLWAVVVGGVLAMGCFAIALQRGPVTAITAVAFTLELIAPSIVGLLIFGDRVIPGSAPLAIIGFVLAGAGAVVLARYSE